MLRFKDQKEKKLEQQRKLYEEQQAEECKKSRSVSRDVAAEIHERLYTKKIKNAKKSNQEEEKSRSVSFNGRKSVRGASTTGNPEEITKKLYEDA